MRIPMKPKYITIGVGVATPHMVVDWQSFSRCFVGHAHSRCRALKSHILYTSIDAVWAKDLHFEVHRYISSHEEMLGMGHFRDQIDGSRFKRKITAKFTAQWKISHNFSTVKIDEIFQQTISRKPMLRNRRHQSWYVAPSNG
jgi:hypothetical protein